MPVTATAGRQPLSRVPRPRAPAASADVEVKIPAGISDGQRIRLGGRGMPASRALPPVICMCSCRVREDERFVREGDDLITALDVAAPLAALGATLEVPTLEGSAAVEMPPGTQPGEVLTLRGEGMPALRVAARATCAWSSTS